MLCMQSAILFNHFRLSVRLSNAGVSKRMQISHFLMVWKVVSFYFYGLLPLQNSSGNPVSGSSAECVRRIAAAAGVINDLDDVCRQHNLSVHAR